MIYTVYIFERFIQLGKHVYMSNRHSFKLQFDDRIRSNCRGLNNVKIDQDYNEAKNSNGESGIKYN